VPIIIIETEVHLDFHIYAILDFDLLIGYPSEMLFQEKSSHASLKEEFGKIASATHSDIPKVEHHPNNDPLKEVKFVTPFVPSSPSLELKQCPSGHPNIVFNSGLHSTNVFPENKKLLCHGHVAYYPALLRGTQPPITPRLQTFWKDGCGCICLP
jgi:hypothetical protein